MQTKTLIWWWSTRRGKANHIFVHELLQSFHYIQFLLSPVIHVLTLDRASSTAEYRFASVSLSEESDEMSAWSTIVLLDGSLCSVTDVDGSLFALGGSLFAADSTWLGGLECLAGDPTSIWKLSASAACFLFLVGGFYCGSGDCIWSIQSINVHHLHVHCNLMQSCFVCAQEEILTFCLPDLGLFFLESLPEPDFCALLLVEPFVPELLLFCSSLLLQVGFSISKSKLLSSFFISARLSIHVAYIHKHNTIIISNLAQAVF